MHCKQRGAACRAPRLAVGDWRAGKLGFSRGISVDSGGLERDEADRDVLGALGAGGAVAHTFAARGDHGLPGLDFEHPGFRFDAQRALQHYGVFVKFRLLARLAPARGAVHVRNTYAGVARVYAPDVFVNLLVAGDGDAGGRGNQAWHGLSVVAFGDEFGQGGEGALRGGIGEFADDGTRLVGEGLGAFAHAFEAAAALDHAEDFGE